MNNEQIKIELNKLLENENIYLNQSKRVFYKTMFKNPINDKIYKGSNVFINILSYLIKIGIVDKRKTEKCLGWNTDLLKLIKHTVQTYLN